VETPTRLGLLELWEQARGLHPLDRALAMAGAAFPDAPREALAELSAGERDAVLLELRRAAFGARMPGYADCPRCGQRLEFTLDAERVRLQAALPHTAGRTVRLESGLAFRLPTSRDLARVAGEGGPEAAARRLADLCRVEAADDGGAADWPDAVLAEVEAAMAEADPQADVELDFDCAVCGHPWRVPFDVAGYVWEEIESRAGRLLVEVHALARAYGWTERDILALSDARRAAYLELAGA
jgi:hypothetical protein